MGETIVWCRSNSFCTRYFGCDALATVFLVSKVPLVNPLLTYSFINYITQYKNVAKERRKWQDDDNDNDDDDKDSGDIHVRIVSMDYILYGTSIVL